MDIFGLRIFVEVQYDIFKILSPKNIYRSLPSKIDNFPGKNSTFCSKPSECINMHQNASKCMQNELCKCFVHEIIQNAILITSKGSKINEIHLPLYGGTPCIISI